MIDKERLIVAEIPRLRRYARALTGDRAAADDLVQDCLERAWSRFHLWRRGSDMRAWLFTVMHNIHVNDLRQARRRPSHQAFAEDMAGPPASGTPSRPWGWPVPSPACQKTSAPPFS